MASLTLPHLILAWLVLATDGAGRAGEQPPWEQVLGPPQGTWAEPQDSVEWRSDLAAAVVEAAASGRPLFVTLRCLPCKQCAGFDQAVLEGGPLLDPLLRRFITVRIIDAALADLRILPMATHQEPARNHWPRAGLVPKAGRLRRRS